MNKIEYIGDGNTRTFVFAFPFFTTDDIVVKLNGIIQTDGFTITTVDNAENADIPYSGGEIIFDVAPATSVIITIYRQIVLNRVVDYQPTLKITPEALNQDLNFTMEALKDFRNTLTEFASKYAQVLDVPAMETMMQAIEMFGDRQEIDMKLDTKASVDADNISSIGKTNITSFPMPGTKYVDLTTDTSSDIICSGTAPANGYVFIRIHQGASGKYLLIRDTSNGMEITLDTTRGTGYSSLFLPVSKNHKYQINTNCTGAVSVCRFIYAQGDE